MQFQDPKRHHHHVHMTAPRLCSWRTAREAHDYEADLRTARQLRTLDGIAKGGPATVAAAAVHFAIGGDIDSAAPVVDMANLADNIVAPEFVRGQTRAAVRGSQVARHRHLPAPGARFEGDANKIVNQGLTPDESGHNCQHCVGAVDAHLAGHPASALPLGDAPRPSMDEFLDDMNLLVDDFEYVAGMEDIVSMAKTWDPDAAGVVYAMKHVGEPGPKSDAHVFNVHFDGSSVQLIDATVKGGKPSPLEQWDEMYIARVD